MNVRRIPLVDLRRDGGTQVRETMNAATVQDYADALAEGVEFPAVTVFFDGEAHWLADGFHRVLAHQRAGLVDVLAEIRTGSKRDALWFALSANGKHGLQMSPADRRRAIGLMLKDEEWGKSDRSVADKLGVSPTTVGKIRKEMGCAGVQSGHLRTPKEGSDGKTYGIPGDASAKVRELLADPATAELSNRAIAKELGVSDRTVAKVRADVVAVGEIPQPAVSTPLGNLPSHPTIDAIASAPTRDALDAAYTAANGAGLSGHDAEEAGKVYQHKAAELRAQAPATTPTVPTHEQVDLFTQAAPAAPFPPAATHGENATKETSPSPVPPTVPAADAAEVAALRAEVEAYRAWINGLCEQPVSNGTVNLDKVRRLIALSRSPNENEARNAAALACKAICDAGLIVISADDPRLNGSGTDLDMAALKRSMTDAFVDIFNMARAARVHP